jgi:diguanylate cyclase (GGDEF)-like protein/PAS domain S-box-containing protein
LVSFGYQNLLAFGMSSAIYNANRIRGTILAMEIFIQVIIIVSVLLQFAAAILAFRLIHLTRRIIAWSFIALANLFMAIRRCLTFYGGLYDPFISTTDLASAVTTLGISAIMLLGVALIRPLFLAIDGDKKRLAQSQQEFQLLVSNIPATVFTGYRDGTVRFYDNKVMEITGYSREIFEMNKRKWSDIVVEEDWQKAKKIFIEALKSDMAYVREYRLKHKYRKFIWLEERARIILDSEGKIDHISGVFYDITEKRQIEATLHDAMAKLESTVTTINKHSQQISLLNEMGELLQSCLTLQEAYQSIIQVIPRLFPELAGTLFIVTPRKSQFLQVVASWGEVSVDEKIFTLDECWALRRGGVHIGKNYSSGLVCKHIPASPVDYMCVPLIAHGEILGLIYMQVSGESSGDTQEGSADSLLIQNQQLAVTVAKQISMALANLSLRESLHIQAIIDPLTGLYNRRYMEETLAREIYRGRRREAPIGIILMDIDFFKSINDTYGHEAGDTLLAALGEFFKKHIRREDVPCRYGGEEVLLILPDANLENTYKRAEELRDLISRFNVKHLGLSLGKITASFGVASCPENGEDMEDVIRAADAALYLAKAGGRNQVIIADATHQNPGPPPTGAPLTN